ncbi:type I-C CRISPR-associated protein Cas8c/Csd1 [Bifidobacterium polysaccharolyticum]
MSIIGSRGKGFLPSGASFDQELPSHQIRMIGSHPKIKGLPGGEGMGASLVSAAPESSWSYGKQRGLVSPVGAQEATAYADALNYMLATPGWHAPIGRAASVVCWSDDADPRYPDTLLHQAGLRQTPPPEDADGLDESMPCHVMALSSAKGRAIVLMHEDASYGRMRSRLRRTASDMTGDEDGPAPDMGRILDSLGDQEQGLAVAMLRTMFAGGPYPAGLPRLVEEDIRRAGDVSGTDAMLLRAYYARRPDKACPHGILGPGTHEDSDCLGYRLGRVYYMYAAQIRRLNSPGTFKPLLRQTLCSTAARPSHGIPALDRRLRTSPSKADRRWYLHLARAVTPVGRPLPGPSGRPGPERLLPGLQGPGPGHHRGRRPPPGQGQEAGPSRLKKRHAARMLRGKPDGTARPSLQPGGKTPGPGVRNVDNPACRPCREPASGHQRRTLDWSLA